MVGSIRGSGTTSVPSQAAKRAARARIISNNSPFSSSPFLLPHTNILFISYRIHLSPGSRRSSARTNAARKRASASSSSTRSTNTESPSPQQKATPPLEQGRYSYHSISAASTPPLGQVSLPPVSALPHSRTAPVTGRLSGTSSPHSSYSSDTHQVLRPLSSPVLSLPVSSSLHYNYRSNDDQTSSNSYSAFVNTPTDLGASQNHAVGGSNFAYANTQATYGAHSRSASPSGVVSSRHSISHINNPQYPSHGQSPSPNSVSSHTSHSGPPTPTYPIPYSHSATAAVHNGQMHTQVNHFQNVYTPNPVVADSPRFLPPLTLAPIPDERYIRRVDLLRPPHNPTPYLHHSQPFSNYSPYHQSIGLGHGWKPEGMRKGLTML